MIALLLIAALATPPDEAQLLFLDHVERYAAPDAFVLDGMLGDGGTAVYDVDVNEDGSVKDWNLVSQTFGAGSVTVDALQKWRFVVERGERPHRRRVTFIVERPRETECDHTPVVRYESPLTLRVQPAKARGMCLPRVDGKIPPKECEVHHVAMSVERLPFHGSGPPPLPRPAGDPRVVLETEFGSRVTSDFPHAWRYAEAGCVMPAEQYAEAYICPKCREAEDAWLKAHPNYLVP